MSILSTNKKLISIGAEYSAGSGINITDHIISVVESAVGTNYSAGPNIDIYDDEGQPTISSKDWSNDIEQASANAYEQAIAQIPAPQDLSYLSGRIDTNTSGIDYISSVCLTAHQDWTDTIKGASSYSYEQSTSYFDNWISGQYTGDITNITNKITALSGDFSSYYKKTETSSKDEINDALQYVSANAGKVYEGVSPIVVNNNEDKISADTWTFSAGANVSFVDNNVDKVTRIDVELPTPQDLSYISAQVDSANAGVDYLSGVVITALPSDLATTGDIADLAQSVSETYQTKGDYLVRSDSANFYPANNPSGFITGVDLSNYYTKNETSGADELAYAFSQIGPGGDEEVNELVHSNSGEWNNVSSKLNESTFQETSGLFLTAIPQEYITESELPSFISAKLDTTSFSTVSGSFLTAVNLTPYVPASSIGRNVLDYITGISGYDISAKRAVNAEMAGYSNSAGTAYKDRNGNQITAYYQTTAGMTAYQPAGDYATTATTNTLSEQIEELSGTISAKHTLSAGEGISFFEDDVNNITRIDCTVTGGGQGSSDTFIIIPGTTTNKEVSENSGKNMLLYMSGSNEYLPYAGKTTYSNYSIFSFKNISGTQSNFNNANHVRMNIWPASTSACTVRDVNSVSLLDTNSTVNYAETAYYDGNGNSLTQTFNDLTALNSFVQSNSASWGGSSTGSDTNVIFRKNDYNGSSISTYVADASDLYFEAAVSEYEGSPTPLLLNNVNGQGSIQVYWNQVSSDFGYNFYSASVTDLQPGTYEISRNGFTYESCYMSANGVKTEALNQGQYECSTALAVKFNVQGSNITGYIDGTINGIGTILTSFTGSLTDFTAKGYERYYANFGAEDYNNGYNYDLSAEFGEFGSTVASGDVFPPTNNLDPYTTYYLGWNANNGGLQWFYQGGN